MIDYLFAAPSLDAAIADPALASFWMGDDWNRTVVNDGDRIGLRIWSDVNDLPDGTHVYLPGFWISISANARNAALEASPLLVLGADRDLALAGSAREDFIIALGPGQSLDYFIGMHVSPLMAGATYPFGA